jgi:DNA-binding CsgD family transcriptional regulator
MVTEQGVNQCLKNVFDHLPGAWGIKDKHYRYVYLNSEFKALLGLKDKDDITGRTDYDMPCETRRCGEAFQKQDQYVIDTLQCLKILDVHPFAEGWFAYFFKKSPWLNEKNEVMGTILYGENISTLSFTENLSLSYYLQNAEQNKLCNIDLPNLAPKPILTKRQLEVLFYTLQGKTLKMTGKALKISPRTVEVYLQQLKCALKATDKINLIEKAFSLGYWNLLELSLFKVQLSLVLPEKE